MSTREFKEELYSRLLSLPASKKVNPTQVVVRCPFCGDSQRDMSHGHMYVKIDPYNDDIPVMYNCFRISCGEHGIMTPEVLRAFDIYDLDMSSNLSRYNKKAVSKLSKKIGFRTGKLNYNVPLASNIERNIRKKKYIEERMGISMSFEDVRNLKIILSLGDFLIYNKIDIVNCTEYIAKKIEADYVGFLSLKNNFIVFRDITGKHKERYIKYTIEKDLLNNGTFYTIPVNIDLLTTDKIEIHLAEGTFDTLGVFYHVMDKQTYNKIYVSVTGGNYIAPIKYFLNLGIIGNVDVHIYSDQGVGLNFYRRNVKNKIAMFVDNIYVHYNERSKDCGVTKDKISLTTHKL